MKRRKDPPAALVTGPGVEQGSPSVGAGLSLAQGLACRALHAVTFYVRSDDRSYAVERDEQGVVWTMPLERTS